MDNSNSEDIDGNLAFLNSMMNFDLSLVKDESENTEVDLNASTSDLLHAAGPSSSLTSTASYNLRPANNSFALNNSLVSESISPIVHSRVSESNRLVQQNSSQNAGIWYFGFLPFSSNYSDIPQERDDGFGAERQTTSTDRRLQQAKNTLPTSTSTMFANLLSNNEVAEDTVYYLTGGQSGNVISAEEAHASRIMENVEPLFEFDISLPQPSVAGHSSSDSGHHTSSFSNESMEEATSYIKTEDVFTGLSSSSNTEEGIDQFTSHSSGTTNGNSGSSVEDIPFLEMLNSFFNNTTEITDNNTNTTFSVRLPEQVSSTAEAVSQFNNEPLVNTVINEAVPNIRSQHSNNDFASSIYVPRQYEFCRFCFSNNQPEYQYRNHSLHGFNDKNETVIMCPTLRSHICPICGLTGDFAHTANYCPANPRNKFAINPPFQQQSSAKWSTEDGTTAHSTPNNLTDRVRLPPFSYLSDKQTTNLSEISPSCSYSAQNRNQGQSSSHSYTSTPIRSHVRYNRFESAFPSANKLKRGKPDVCKFCRKNGKPPQVYYSHLLKSEDGTVLCPYLRVFFCDICGATGDNAHTRKYCPYNTYETFIQQLMEN